VTKATDQLLPFKKRTSAHRVTYNPHRSNRWDGLKPGSIVRVSYGNPESTEHLPHVREMLEKHLPYLGWGNHVCRVLALLDVNKQPVAHRRDGCFVRCELMETEGPRAIGWQGDIPFGDIDPLHPLEVLARESD